MPQTINSIPPKHPILRAMNQSTTRTSIQTTNRTSNPSTNQPNNQTTGQTTNRQIDQPSTERITHAIKPSSNESIESIR